MGLYKETNAFTREGREGECVCLIHVPCIWSVLYIILYMYMYIHVYTYMYMTFYIRIHVHVHTHTHTHAHTHAHRSMSMSIRRWKLLEVLKVWQLPLQRYVRICTCTYMYMFSTYVHVRTCTCILYTCTHSVVVKFDKHCNNILLNLQFGIILSQNYSTCWICKAWKSANLTCQICGITFIWRCTCTCKCTCTF